MYHGVASASGFSNFSKNGGGFLKKRRLLASRSSAGSPEPVNDWPVASKVATKPPITPHAITAVGIERARGSRVRMLGKPVERTEKVPTRGTATHPAVRPGLQQSNRQRIH